MSNATDDTSVFYSLSAPGNKIRNSDLSNWAYMCMVLPSSVLILYIMLLGPTHIGTTVTKCHTIYRYMKGLCA